jgi:hypothetical protein
MLEHLAHPDLRPALEMLPAELVLRSSCGCDPDAATRRPVPRVKAKRAGRRPSGVAG